MTDYNILDSNYIISESSGMESGFTNNDAVYDDDGNIIFENGRPIFSHFNIYPKSHKLIESLPFNATFNDTRPIVLSNNLYIKKYKILTMAKVINQRMTAKIEGDFVVFLIGMRINRFWKFHKWIPVATAMPKMGR